MTASPDPGLQTERTVLAWQRTCLALAAASIIGLRVTVGDLGDLAILLGFLGAGLTGAAFAGAVYRHRHSYDIIATPGSRVAGGLLLALLFVALLAISVGAVAYLLAQWFLV
jgi:hypothetical protein